jgi:hypothetical protein
LIALSSLHSYPCPETASDDVGRRMQFSELNQMY